jgi:Flp pilus assembly protein TadB
MVKAALVTLFMLGMIMIVNPIVSTLSVKWRLKRRIRLRRKNQKNRDHVKVDFESIPLICQLQKYMSVAQMELSPFLLIAIAVSLFLFVYLTGMQLIGVFWHSFLFALLFASLPFLIVWFRVQKQEQRMFLVMIPTVQAFVGCFTEQNNLYSAIQLSTSKVPYEIKHEWQRLVMDLSTKEDFEESLYTFAERVNNDWAKDFVDILMIHRDTGADIVPSLFKLVNEMQNNLFNEERRVTILSAQRWGTMLMIALAIVIVGVNITLDSETRHYYFEAESGRNFTLLSVIVLFGAFIYSLYLGKRRF